MTDRREENHFATGIPDNLATCHTIHLIITPLYKDIWSDFADKRIRCVFVKKGDIIHRLKGAQDVSALTFIQDGPLIPLDAPDGCISIQRDNQAVTEAARHFQKFDVTDMNQVKATIGENNAPTQSTLTPHNLQKFPSLFYFFYAHILHQAQIVCESKSGQ